MSKKHIITNLLAGLALALTANFALAQGQQDLEVFSLDFAKADSSQAVPRTMLNGQPPPFRGAENLGSFNEIPNGDLDVPASYIAVTTAEIKSIVEDMRNRSTVSDSHGSKVIGLHSSMVKQSKKDKTKYEVVTLRNGDDSGIVNLTTDHNLSWYPDWKDVNNPPAGYTFPFLRFTVGDFYPGKMPFPLKAHLKIPEAMLKWNSNKSILYFDARATSANSQPLDSNTNFIEFMGTGHMFSVPISEFFGYWNKNTNEWKVKIVVDSKLTPPQSGHPVLNMRFYSKGTPLTY